MKRFCGFRSPANGSASAGTPDTANRDRDSTQETVMKLRTYPEVQPADPADSSASAQHAVQVALDRRDNGGDARSAGHE